MWALEAALAVVAAHLLPGRLLVDALGVGRDPLERWTLAGVFGGPLAALVYRMSLALASPVSYGATVALLDIAALVLLYRNRRRHARSRTSGMVLVWLWSLITLVEGAYFATTGYLFHLDEGGNLVMDQALQRDTLFHVGVVRALEVSYPPALLSTSSVTMAYHAGYHLQAAAWSRYFGIDVFDGLYRLGMGWYLALFVLSAFLLGRRFGRSDRLGIGIAALVFGSGLGFFFLRSLQESWASLVFMDALLVSVFLVNPLLPALSLLLAGLALLDDYLEAGGSARLVASVFCLGALFAFKVFLGAQVVAGLVLAAALAGANQRTRLRRAAGALLIVALPWIALASSGASNTAVGVRPLEVVRYSMEKLEWPTAIESLARVGRFEGDLPAWLWAGLGTLFWGLGFLGLRALALPGAARDAIRQSAGVRFPMVFMAGSGFVAALVFRIAPAEATGLSRVEAQNDVIWFAAQSGLLLWPWTAEALARIAARGRAWRGVTISFAVLLAFSSTVQHFVAKVSLGTDRITASLVQAGLEARAISKPDDVWVDPPDRVHPSVIPYIAGRPIVYDGYVGYDYMFVPEAEIERRRHAVAQFWRTEDPGFVRWFWGEFGVNGVLETGAWPAPASASRWLELQWQREGVRLYRVVAPLGEGPSLITPRSLPLGVAGVRFFGRGWGPPQGSPPARALLPGTANLYLPAEDGITLRLTIELEAPHAFGELALEGRVYSLSAGQTEAEMDYEVRRPRGLKRLLVEWRGRQPLIVRGVRVDVIPSQ